MSNAVRISSFELVVPGQFVRRYDKVNDATTVTITGEQASAIHEALATVAQFFELNPDPVTAP